MKRLSLLCSAILCAITLCAETYRYSYSIGEHEYHLDFTYTVAGGEATITDFDYPALDAAMQSGGLPLLVEILEELPTFDGDGNQTGMAKVVAIASKAFDNCAGVMSIDIPVGLTIADDAFAGAAPGVLLADNIYGGMSTDQLVTLVIPAEAEVARAGRFNGMTQIQWLRLESGLLAVEPNAFAGCTGIQLLELPASITTYGDGAFDGVTPTGLIASRYPADGVLDGSKITSLGLSDGEIKVGVEAFRNRKDFNLATVTTLEIPASVTTIAEEAFLGCAPETLVAAWLPSGLDTKNLKHLVIPAGVTKVRDYAFYNCQMIETLRFAEGVVDIEIGYAAFANCVGLNEIYLTANVKTISETAFRSNLQVDPPAGGSAAPAAGRPIAPTILEAPWLPAEVSPENITTLTIPSGVETLPDNAFPGCVLVTEVVIPETVKTIGDDAFAGCSALATVTFAVDQDGNNALTSIGARAFDGCALTQLAIPEGVTTIGEAAFRKNQLTELTLPLGVKTIGAEAFAGNALDPVEIPVSVETIGQDAFAGSAPTSLTAPWVPSGMDPSKIATLTIPDGVQTLRKGAFAGCSQVQTIVVPDSVTAIGEDAFAGCSAATTITLPTTGNLETIGEGAFAGCTAVTAMTIPEGVTTIGDRAFAGCSALASVDLPDSLETIGASAFENCALIDLEIPAGVTVIGDRAFAGNPLTGTVTIPAGVKDLGDDAFEGANPSDLIAPTVPEGMDGSNITQLNIAPGTTEIPAEAFKNCTGITEIIIPEGVIKIGARAFAGCTNVQTVQLPLSLASQSANSIDTDAFQGVAPTTLTAAWIPSGMDGTAVTNLTIPAGVTNIPTPGFKGCTGLTEVTVPDGVTTLGTDVFAGCTNLDRVVLPATLTSVSRTAFTNVAPTTLTAPWLPGDMLSTKLVNLTIPAGVAEIPEKAFEECALVPSVVIPEGVTLIDAKAFRNCTVLAAVTFPSTLKTIGEQAFEGTALTALVLPEGLETIEEKAFYNCDALTSVYIPASVTTIGSQAFASCDNLETLVFSKPFEEGAIADDAFANCPKLNTGADGTVTKDGIIYSAGYFVVMGYDETTPPTAVTLHENTQVINDEALEGCTSLTALTIPASVKQIGHAAFRDCSNLATLTFEDTAAKPSQLATIGSAAFRNCAKLTELVLPYSVTAVGSEAFNKCDLEKIVLPNPETSFAEDAFYQQKPKHLTAVGIVGGMEPKGSLETMTFVEGTTSVQPEQFVGYTKLREVTIASTVETIGDRAFGPYSGVEDEWGNLVAVIGCPELTTVTFAKDAEGKTALTTIGAEAFTLCVKLDGIVLPESLTTLGEGTFAGCAALTSLTIPAGVTKIPAYFLDGIEIEYNGKNTPVKWSSAKSLTTVTFKPGADGESPITEIGKYAFSECKALDPIVIPPKVTVIPEYAFYGCWALKTVTIPEGVTRLEQGAFQECDALTTVTLPQNSLTAIGMNAFNGSERFESITIPESVVEIGRGAFVNTAIPADTDGVVYDASGTALLCARENTNPDPVTGVKRPGLSTADYKIKDGTRILANLAFTRGGSDVNEVLKTLTIPASVEHLGQETFSNCTALETVTFESGSQATVIPDRLFSGCTALRAVTLPDALEEIRYNAFGATALESITFPESLETIGELAFTNCRPLKSVTFPTNVTRIASGAFAYYLQDDAYGTLEEVAFYTPNVSVHYDAFLKAPIKKLTGWLGPKAYAVPTEKLEEMVFWPGTEEIAEGALQNVTALKSVDIPETMRKIGASAFEGCTGLTKLIYRPSDTNSITGEALPYGTLGSRAFAGCTGLTSISLKHVEEVPTDAFAGITPEGAGMPLSVLLDDVPTVREYAFYECTRLTELLLYRVTTIEQHAFHGCTALEKLVWMSVFGPDLSIGDYAFCNSGLLTLELPDFVKHLGTAAFNGCTKLTTAEVGTGITKVPNALFAGCTGLTEVKFAAPITSAGAGVFTNCTSLPTDSYGVRYECEVKDAPQFIVGRTGSPDDFRPWNGVFEVLSSVRFIVDDVFAGCSRITQLTLPDGILSIGARAFKNCTGITAVILPATIEFVGEEAFFGVKPDTLTASRLWGSMGGDKLSRLYIPEKTTAIEAKAFAGCPFLSLIEVLDEDSLDTIGMDAFQVTNYLETDDNGVVYSSKDRQILLKAPASLLANTETTTYEVDGKVRFICPAAFKGCTAITSVILPEDLRRIEEELFYGCTSLASVMLPEELVAVETRAFYTTALTTLTFPETLTTLGAEAFRGTPLEKVTFKGTVPAREANVFTPLGTNPKAKGSYDTAHQTAWLLALQTNPELWSDLEWSETLQLPAGVDVTSPEGEWLLETLAAAGVTSGKVTLAEGTDLKAAYLLGIAPEYTVSSAGLLSAARTTSTSEVVAAANGGLSIVGISVVDGTLLVSVKATSGKLVKPYKLGGVLAIRAYKELNGTPTPIAVTASTWNVLSDTEAQLLVDEDWKGARFFEAVVSAPAE